MGLTIHYGLKHSGDNAAVLVAKLRQRALDLPFREVGEIVDLSGAACDFEQCGRDDPTQKAGLDAASALLDRAGV